MTEFDQFWAAYPRHVAKLAAAKAYQWARGRASAEEILAGLEAYCGHMPREEQFRPHASSWLRAGRWMDEYPERQQPQSEAEDWFSCCKRLHNLTCNGRYDHHLRMEIEAQKAQEQS